MRQIQIRRISSWLEYRTEPNNVYWKVLPTDIRTLAEIKQYFTEGRDRHALGRYDEPRLEFVDEAGKPCTYYTLTKEGKLYADFDPGRTLALDPGYFRTTLEQVDFFRERSDPDTIERAYGMETLEEERDYLLKTARPEAVKEYQGYISQAVSPETVTTFATSHAKRAGTSPVVIIE